MSAALQYFDLNEAPASDTALAIAKEGGYVPENCLLGGDVVLFLVFDSLDPCRDCAGPRVKCGGRAIS